MIRLIVVAVYAILAFPLSAIAEERQRIGFGILVTNDVIGDTRDRWNSGSVAASLIWGPESQGQLPEEIGQLLEFRFQGEILAPDSLKNPAPGDRPFAGVLSFGLHTHYRLGLTEIALGADLVVTGPQTELDDLKESLHDLFGGQNLSARTRREQIDNGVYPSLVLEVGREFQLGGSARIRPFVEGRAGVETLLRAGADLTVGQFGNNVLMVRAPVTGHRYRAMGEVNPGLSFVLGADIAYVDDSKFLPKSSGVTLTDSRSRLRAGMNWANKRGLGLFYGVTWMGEQFEAQNDGELVGSLRLNFKF